MCLFFEYPWRNSKWLLGMVGVIKKLRYWVVVIVVVIISGGGGCNFFSSPSTQAKLSLTLIAGYKMYPGMILSWTVFCLTSFSVCCLKFSWHNYHYAVSIFFLVWHVLWTLTGPFFTHVSKKSLMYMLCQNLLHRLSNT